MNNKRMGKQAERIQRFVYKKINKQLISVAGSVLIVLGSYAIVPVQVLATETATEEAAQAQPNTAALPTVASSELASETPPPTANHEGAAQETPPTTTDDAKAQKETEPKSAGETKKSEETDQQADTAKTRAQPQPRANTNSEGWVYENRGTYVEITNYTGDLVNITVPAKIDGLPVEINLGTVLKEKMANENETVTETFKIESAGEGETPVKLVGTFKELFAMPGVAGGANSTLTSVDFGNANCSEIEDMSSMFRQCIGLEKLDLSGWNTSRVQSMETMFYDCSQLEELNLTGWNTSKVESMSYMFSWCSQLKELNNLSGWNTSQVQYMGSMFYGCSQLQELDLAGWDTSQIANDAMGQMFFKSNNLSTLTLSSDFEFKGDTGLRGLSDATSRWVKDDFAAMYDSTDDFIEAHNDLTETATNHTYKIKTLDNPTAEGWWFDDKGSYMEITSYDGDPTNITVPAKIYGKPVEINLGTVLKEKMANKDAAPTEKFRIESVADGEIPVKLVGTFKNLFARFNYTTIENDTLQSVDFGNANTTSIDDMSRMFDGCSQLNNLNISGWDTSNVKDMGNMFSSCSSLVSLDVSKWDTSQVEVMLAMFYDCSLLQNLDITYWNTSQVRTMTGMFYNCSNLENLNLSDWNTSQVKQMNYLFYNCSNLENLNLSGWNTSQLESMPSMFYNCSQLKELNLSGWDTSKVENVREIFSGCTQLKSLDLSGWSTVKLDYDCLENAFSGCDNLSTLTLSSDFEFKADHDLRELPNPSGKTTYHWVKDDYEADYDSTADFTTAHNNLTGASTNHVYTIQKKYEVSFDLNGGSGNTPSPQYIFENKSADKPDYKGTKGDLIFDEWTFNGDPFIFDTPITEPIELTASWRKAKYSIKFDPNGGEGTMSDQELSVDEELPLSVNSYTRKGYDFDGWNKESNGGGDSYSDKEAVKNLSTTEGAQVKLYAQWNPITYTVTFDSKDGSQVSDKEYTIEKGIDSFETPTRSGYTFEGWYDGEDKVTKIEKGETGNRTLIAKWTPVKYKVTFDSNGGTPVSEKEYTIEKGIASFETPTRTGYTFDGWYDGQTKVESIPNGETGNRSLEAKWKIETYTVTFDSKNGSGISPKTYTIEQGIDSFETPTRSGYTFEGWYDGEDKVTTIGKGETGNRTLIAKWTPVTYKVTFDSAGGNAIDSMPCTIEETISTLPKPTRKGHKFIGWFEGENLVTEIPIGGTSDRTLTAKWEAITYTITFADEGLSPINYTISDQSIALPEGPERAGYRFLGWLVSEEKLNRSTQSTNSIVRSLAAGTIGNLRLTAQYEAIKYTVTFDSAGGSSIDPITFTTENSVTKLPEPARIGYRFLGWYDGETKVTELPKGTTGNKTLTAKWEKIKTTEVIEEILKEENQKNRNEQDYTEDSWKNYQEAKKAAEDLLKEVNPDPLKAEQVLAKLQAAIKGLTLKDATAPTPVGTTNIPVSKKVYPTAQAKQYPRTNMVTTIWPGFIGTGLVAAVVALVKKNKK